MEEEEEGGQRGMEGRREEEILDGAPSSLKELNKTSLETNRGTCSLIQVFRSQQQHCPLIAVEGTFK